MVQATKMNVGAGSGHQRTVDGHRRFPYGPGRYRAMRFLAKMVPTLGALAILGGVATLRADTPAPPPPTQPSKDTPAPLPPLSVAAMQTRMTALQTQIA